MNYEKVILELLGRIQTLEEQVATLMSKQENGKEENKMTTTDIKAYIEEQKRIAKDARFARKRRAYHCDDYSSCFP